MSEARSEGVVSLRAAHSFDQTVARIEQALKEKAITMFAVIDHAEGAAKVGMKMPPAKVIIFGNPVAGTPLMLASPKIAIDLPLKILVAEDDKGIVWVSYTSPLYLQERYGLPSDLMKNIAGIEAIARLAVS